VRCAVPQRLVEVACRPAELGKADALEAPRWVTEAPRRRVTPGSAAASCLHDFRPHALGTEIEGRPPRGQGGGGVAFENTQGGLEPAEARIRRISFLNDGFFKTPIRLVDDRLAGPRLYYI